MRNRAFREETDLWPSKEEIVMKRLALLTVAIVLAAAMNVWAGEDALTPAKPERRQGATLPLFDSSLRRGAQFRSSASPSGISRRHFPPATGNAAAGRAY